MIVGSSFPPTLSLSLFRTIEQMNESYFSCCCCCCCCCCSSYSSSSLLIRINIRNASRQFVSSRSRSLFRTNEQILLLLLLLLLLPLWFFFFFFFFVFVSVILVGRSFPPAPALFFSLSCCPLSLSLVLSLSCRPLSFSLSLPSHRSLFLCRRPLLLPLPLLFIINPLFRTRRWLLTVSLS